MPDVVLVQNYTFTVRSRHCALSPEISRARLLKKEKNRSRNKLKRQRTEKTSLPLKKKKKKKKRNSLLKQCVLLKNTIVSRIPKKKKRCECVEIRTQPRSLFVHVFCSIKITFHKIGALFISTRLRDTRFFLFLLNASLKHFVLHTF